MVDLLSLNYSELRDFTVNILGESAFRAQQISSWLTKGSSIDEMTNLSFSLREKLKEHATVSIPQIAKKLVSSIDNTVKYLFLYADGNLVESVVMHYEHGVTICVSSQVGCRMGCRFCASTIGGKIRDLTCGEILGQVIAAQKDTSERITNIVMMGIGEPLDNYDNVIKFIRIVSSKESLNIGQRHISLSTSGIVDKIDLLSKEDLQITLSISLLAYDDETRSSIMPINNKWNIDSLLKACKRYFDTTGRRISFEYTLISGKNDQPEGAVKLAALLKKYLNGIPFHVNLIPVNEVKENSFRTSGKAAVRSFCEILNGKGINATVRRKLGEDINAACGQLRRSEVKDS